MSLLISIAFAVAGSIVVGFALRAIFRSLEPSSIKQYRACKGGWWEEKLNHCESGLVKLPQQPVNTYTNIAYLTGGAFLMFYLNTFPSMVFFITSLYLCTGSALYHATSTRWAGRQSRCKCNVRYFLRADSLFYVKTHWFRRFTCSINHVCCSNIDGLFIEVQI